MAKEHKETVETKPVEKQEAKVVEKKQEESIYKASEFAACAAEVFGTRPECVATALKVAGKETCTLSEAKGIVEKFLKKEVK